MFEQSGSWAATQWGARLRATVAGCCTLSRMSLTPLAQLGLLRLLARRPARGVLLKRPRIAFKYLHKYLFTSFPRRARLKALHHHYAFLGSQAAPDFYGRVLGSGHTLWQRRIGDDTLAVGLRFPCPADQEGDLALVLLLDQRPVYILSFSIIPGALLGQAGAPLIFVARVQGTSTLEAVRHATRLCGEICPAALLISALEGFAEAFGIGALVGVGAAEQLSRLRPATAPSYSFDYDHFWQSVGAQSVAGGFFHMPIPLPHKDLEVIRAKHRKRTEAKRAFKAEVSHAAAAYVRQHCLKPNGHLAASGVHVRPARVPV